MMFRAFAAAIAGVVLTLAATPAAAQHFSDSYQFLEAIRSSDGNKVTTLLANKSLRIVNTRDRDTGEGAIHIVTKRKDSLYLRVLLQQEDINPNLQDRDGNTALVLAAEGNWDEGVAILLRYHASVNLGNSSGETALIRAVQRRNTEMARALLEGGADPDKADILAGMSARDYARADTRAPASLAKLLADAPKVQPRANVSGPRL
jgi:ankyrin repeat protein